MTGIASMQIGLFGGTFNPVHLGHLRAAVDVREGFDLDEIFLIPAATAAELNRRISSKERISDLFACRCLARAGMQ